jgi:hypothetical protein
MRSRALPRDARLLNQLDRLLAVATAAAGFRRLMQLLPAGVYATKVESRTLVQC